MDYGNLLYSPDDEDALLHRLTYKAHGEVVDHLTGAVTLSGSGLLQADANQDHTVDAADVVILLNVGR